MFDKSNDHLHTPDLEDLFHTLDLRATQHLDGGYLARVLRKRQLRRPVPFIDEHGIQCLRVPLNDARTSWAVVELEDWVAVQNSGADGLWFRGGRGHVATKFPMQQQASADTCLIARLILGLGKGQTVRFVSRDFRNLRRNNLAVRGPDDPRQTGLARHDARSVAAQGALLRASLVARQR